MFPESHLPRSIVGGERLNVESEGEERAQLNNRELVEVVARPANRNGDVLVLVRTMAIRL